MITFIYILCSSVLSCGRSQVVCEAGAWSLARADPFYLCLLCFCFVFVLMLTSGGIFQVSCPWGPPGLGGPGPISSPQFSHALCCCAAAPTDQSCQPTLFCGITGIFLFCPLPTHVCMYMCACTCVYMCIWCIHIYIYIYTHTSLYLLAGLKPTGAGRSKVQKSWLTARIRDAAAYWHQSIWESRFDCKTFHENEFREEDELIRLLSTVYPEQRHPWDFPSSWLGEAWTPPEEALRLLGWGEFRRGGVASEDLESVRGTGGDLARHPSSVGRSDYLSLSLCSYAWSQ